MNYFRPKKFSKIPTWAKVTEYFVKILQIIKMAVVLAPVGIFGHFFGLNQFIFDSKHFWVNKCFDLTNLKIHPKIWAHLWHRPDRAKNEVTDKNHQNLPSIY